MLFPRTPAGLFTVQLGDDHRALIRQLASGIAEVIATGELADDLALRRLFPPAYSDDEEKNEEYSRLMHDDLRKGRLDALSLLEESSAADELTEEQMLGWMGALNDIRLFLGTRLGVTEDLREVDEDDPRAPMLAVYGFLSLLQEEIIDALRE